MLGSAAEVEGRRLEGGLATQVCVSASAADPSNFRTLGFTRLSCAPVRRSTWPLACEPEVQRWRHGACAVRRRIRRPRAGIVRVNSILPVRTPGRAEAPLFLLTNCRRARPDSTPKAGTCWCRLRRGHHLGSALRNAAASEAFDAAVKIAFLSAFRTESHDARYWA